MSEIIKLSSRYTAFVKHDDKSHDTVICEENVLLHCQLSNNQRDILESLIYSIYHRSRTFLFSLQTIYFRQCNFSQCSNEKYL